MQFSKSKILCIGDIILDSYEFGAVKKISPEAPIPIFKSLNESYVLGGAGNVARNISSGGANCHILSVIGDDLNGKIIRKKISEIPKLKSNLIIEKNRKRNFPQRVTTSCSRRDIEVFCSSAVPKLDFTICIILSNKYFFCSFRFRSRKPSEIAPSCRT